MKKELVKENVTKQDDSHDAILTPCGRGSSCASEASYKCRGGVNVSIDSQNPSPQPSPARGEGAYLDNRGTPQSLISSNHFTHFTHFKKAVTQIIRGAAKARFRRTLRAEFADAHTAPYRKFAFTLAEVLITLGVIGIVAAMTIPTLVNSYKEKQRVTQLKKAYSVLNQAFTMAVADYGTPDNWGLTITNTGETDEEGNRIFDRIGTTNVSKILSKYIKSESLDKGTIISDAIYSLDGRLVKDATLMKVEADNLFYRMNDGTIFTPGWVNSLNCEPYCGDFWIILPGGKSKTFGVDMFNLKLTKKGILSIDSGSGKFDTNCNKSRTDIDAAAQGRGCAGWVIQNGNMDYLHCDDLSWNGKHKCSD